MQTKSVLTLSDVRTIAQAAEAEALAGTTLRRRGRPHSNADPATQFGRLTAHQCDPLFGAVVAGAGAFGLVALGASPFVEVTAARSAAVAAGGFLGAGLVGGIGLLAVPGDLETGSRISAGLGAGGQVLGMVLGALVPGDWLDEPAAITAVPSSSPLSSSSSSGE